MTKERLAVERGLAAANRPDAEQPKVKCAVYARVSTDRQGDSIDNQIDQCREYISRLGSRYDSEQLLVYRDEAVSGYYTSVFERAEMKRAIADARAGRFQLLVFKEISRVGRDKLENPAIIGMFEQYGVRVIAINDNYDSLNKDNITFDILSVLSEQESKKISARVSSARKQKARRGEWSGEPPIGYIVCRETKRLKPDPETRAIPPLIFDLYAEQGLGTLKIAQTLNRLGYRTKNGKLWSRDSVGKVLRNPAYIGRVVYGTRRNRLKREYDDQGKMTKRKLQIRTDPAEWQIVENAHEPLVERRMFEKAAAILAGKRQKHAPRRALHPLTGLLVCGRCGEGMVCQKRNYNGKTYRYYICKTYHKYGREYCPQANVNADRLEEALCDRIRAKLLRFPGERLRVDIDMEQELRRLGELLRDVRAAQQNMTRDQIALFRQRELFDEGAYRLKMTELKQQLARAAEEEAVLRRRIGELSAERQNGPSVPPWLEPLRTGNLEPAVQWILSEGGPERKRAVLRELIERITLTGNRLHVEYRHRYDMGAFRYGADG